MSNLSEIQGGTSVITQEEVDEAIRHHNLWCESGGKSGTRMEYVDRKFINISFGGYPIEAAIFRKCQFNGVNFKGSEMGSARFLECSLFDVDFTGAKLAESQFSRSNILSANFSGANLHKSDFTQAELHDVRDAVFDQTKSRGLLTSGLTDEAWTKIAHRYTGRNLAIITILFLIFLLPYIAEAIALITAAELGQTVSILNLKGPDIASIQDPQEISLIWILIGGRQDNYLLGHYAFVFNVFVIIFQMLRACLTWLVSSLSHAEARTGRTPPLIGQSWRMALGSYGYLRKVDFLVKWSGGVVLVGAFFSLTVWLMKTVPVYQ